MKDSQLIDSSTPSYWGLPTSYESTSRRELKLFMVQVRTIGKSTGLQNNVILNK